MPEPSSAPRMFHLSLNVADLERSVDFYRVLFGQEPARHEVDYAKFEVADPPLVLALEPRATDGAGALNHVGVRVSDASEVEAMQDRLMSAGLDAQLIAGVECCYSRQTKICTWDPDRTLWEIYVLDDDGGAASATGGVSASVASARATASGGGRASVRDHLLGDPFPPLASEPAGSVDEVRLRGTLNAALDERAERDILAATLHALRPGGRLQVHMMVGDRPVSQALPELPGPAALVRRVPVATDVLRAIEQAGFVGLTCARYSHSPVFRFAGVEMRELLLSASKREEAAADEASRAVLYKGPFRSITDDDGVVFPRGEHVFVAPATFELLRRSSLAEHFVFVTTDASCGADAADGCAAPA